MSEKAETVTVETLLSEQDWLRALARRLVRDDSQADDLLQDVFVRVISSPPRTVRSLRGWLTRVLVNRHRDVSRSDGARAGREELVSPRRPIPSAAELAARVDAQRQVAAAVVELDEPLRETVLLHFYEDLSVRAIGRRMGVPYETARARLKRGLDQLRAQLAPSVDGGARRWSSAFLALAALDRTEQVAAAAALTGVVIVMKKKIAIVAAVLIMLVAGVGIWKAAGSDPIEPVPDRVPEELADLPGTPIEVPEITDVAVADSTAAGETKPAEEPLDPERGTCHGRITNPDGTPAVGVSVRLSGRPAKVVQTDRNGNFRITNEWVDPLGRSLYVGAKTGLLAVGNVPLRAGADTTFDAVIPAGRLLAVEVVSAVDGRPLAGVWTCFQPLDKPDYPNALCITDEEGRGRLATIPARDFRVYIGSQGFQPHAERLDLTSGVHPEVLRIALDDPEEFRLRVSPLPPGKKPTGSVAFLPVPDDPVQGQHHVFLEFDENGVATGVAPPPGRYRVHVDVYDVVRRMIEDVVVREREPVEIGIDLEVGVEVRGVLLDPAGKPLVGDITLNPKLTAPLHTPRRARTNERGEFRITGFPPCRCWVGLRVGRQRIHQVLPDVEVGEGGLPDLRIQLEPGAAVSGQLVGSPLPNAHFISIFRRTDQGWSCISSLAPDSHGRFTARYLPPGRAVVLAGPHRAEQGYARPVTIQVREGETAEPIEIQWLSCPPVKLLVVGRDGAAVAGKIEVSAMAVGDRTEYPAGGLLRFARETLDGDGAVVLRSFAPGHVRIEVTLLDDSSRTAAVEVDILESDNPPIRIVLPE